MRRAALDGLAQRVGADLDARQAELLRQEGAVASQLRSLGTQLQAEVEAAQKQAASGWESKLQQVGEAWASRCGVALLLQCLRCRVDDVNLQ